MGIKEDKDVKKAESGREGSHLEGILGRGNNRFNHINEEWLESPSAQ